MENKVVSIEDDSTNFAKAMESHDADNGLRQCMRKWIQYPKMKFGT
jgi:hypothetical protein